MVIKILEILFVSDHGCTERHARALLRLEDDPDRVRQAASYVSEQGLTVAMTEKYVESLLTALPPGPKSRHRPTFIIKDVRLFLNTVNKGLTMMKSAGVNAACDRHETADAILLTIRIPKQAPQH